MVDIAIVFMGFINQRITGGHHPVAVLMVSLLTIFISLPALYGKLIGREMPSFGVPITGIGKCPMTWEYWTSPYSSHLVDHIPNGI